MDYGYRMVSEEKRRRKALIGFYDYMTGELIEDEDIYLISHKAPDDWPFLPSDNEETWTYVVITDQSTADRLDVFSVQYNKYQKAFIYELNIKSFMHLCIDAKDPEELQALRELQERLPGPSIDIDVTYDKDLYEDVFHD